MEELPNDGVLPLDIAKEVIELSSAPGTTSESAADALFAQMNELSAKTAFTTTISRIQYGQYDTKDAVLVQFESTIQYSGSNRVKEAMISLPFHPPGRPGAQHPIIVAFAPGELMGDLQSMNVSTGGEVSLTGGQFVQAGISFKRSKNVEILRATKITGSIRPAREDPSTKSRLVYVLEENGPQKRGIPSNFRYAAIVQLPQPDRACRLSMHVQLKLEGTFNNMIASFRRRGDIENVFIFRWGDSKNISAEWSGVDWKDKRLFDLVRPEEIPKLPEGFT